MKNNIDYLFDSEKFNAILSDIEHQRIEKSSVYDQNAKDNKSSRRAFTLGFLGISGCFTLFIPVIFIAIVALLLASAFDVSPFAIGTFFVLGIAVIVLIVVLLILFLRKPAKTILRTDRENYVITKEYRLLVKEVLLKEIIKSFNDTFEYYPTKAISDKRFYDMQLYSNSYGFSSYKGEDYIVGKVGATTVEMCEFSIGNVSGLFMIADFNKQFKGTTKVLVKITKEYKIDASEILDGQIGINIEGNYSDFIKKRNYYNQVKLEDVQLEDPVFTNAFDVYSSDQIEARYILSNSLMERILAFKSKYNYDMNFVFHDSKLYFTINWGANMIEPYNITISVHERKMDLIKNTHDELSHCISLIDALNMNSAIWYAR